MDHLARQFLLYLEGEKNASPHTLTGYRIALQAFRDFRPGLSWKSATVDDFRTFLFQLMKSGRARSSIRLTFSALKSFYQFLVIRNFIDSNVIKQVDLPKTEKQILKFLTTTQVDGFLKKPGEAEKQKQAPAWMAAGTKPFLSSSTPPECASPELVKLDVKDVDPITETARVFGKGARERICPVGGPALEAISRYRQQAKVHAGPLFINKSRRRLSARSIWLTMKKYLRAAGLPDDLSPHKLRHSFATHLPGCRRGPAQRAITSRSRQPLHHTDLYPCHGREAEARL